MKLNANKFALAAAISFVLLWILCSLIVALMPHQSMHVTGAMQHSDMMTWQWDTHWFGLLLGLVVGSLAAAISTWLFATIYNRLLEGGRKGGSHES